MKQLLTFIILILLFTVPAFAQTPTSEPTKTVSPTAESSNSSLSKQINDLKDKIASRVAQLKLVDKRGVSGVVVKVDETELTILDPQQKTRIIDVDEITKFSSPSAKSTFGISDIAKGSTVSIVGLYNKQSRRILGRFIETTTLPQFLSGVVTDIDEDAFTISIINDANVTTVIDIEKITKTNTYTKEDELTRSGFSKLNVGDRVVITGYPKKNEKNRLTGLRILQLPEAPKNPNISFSATASPTP